MSASLEKFELDSSAVSSEILNSEWMLTYLESIANSRASSLGDGYEVGSNHGSKRANVRIYTASKEAMQENLESNTLLRAIS